MDKPIEKFADALEEWLDKWGRRITQVLWKEYQNRPRGFRRLLEAKQASVLDDEELWQEVLDSGHGIIFKFINEADYAGFAAGDEMLLNIGIVIDFDEVNPAIARLGIDRSMEAIKGINDTTREQLREALRRFYAAPDVGREEFMAALESLFGRTRAEMIAITELTNAFSASKIETARIMGNRLGVALGYEVLTAADERVCEICNDAGTGGPYPLDDTEHRPALHPRCRCDTGIVRMPAR